MDTIKFHKFENPKKITEFGQKCWLIALAASIISSLYQLYVSQHTVESKQSSNREAVRYQLTQDIVDMMIPLGGLKWLNLDEGAIGLAGMITSAMAMHTQWKKTNPI